MNLTCVDTCSHMCDMLLSLLSWAASAFVETPRFQSDGDGAGYPEQRWGFWALVAAKPIQAQGFHKRTGRVLFVGFGSQGSPVDDVMGPEVLQAVALIECL